MAEPDERLRAELARLAAAIERAAADLPLGEEPARFAAVLAGGAPRPAPPAPDTTGRD